MRTILIYLALSITANCWAQKISASFNPVIKGVPRTLEIREHNDGNYLVYGDVAYYQATASGSLVKVDGKGNRVTGFGNVFADQPIQNLCVLPSGKILIQGRFNYVNGIRTGNIAMLNSNGSVDGSFSANKDWKITNFAVQSDGKIVIINGSTLSRLNSDGNPDGTFSTTGSVNFSNIAVASDDKIYLQRGAMFKRFEKDGAVDNTFLYTAPPLTSVGEFALQSDGKILAVILKNMSAPPYTQTYVLEQFHSNGNPDDAFTPATCTSSITSVLVRSNGKIVFTGLMDSFNSVEGNAFELNADGTFSRVVIKTDYNGMNSVYEDGNENVFVTGGFKKINTSAMIKGIAKLNADYSLDQSFKLPVSQVAFDFYLPIAVQSDGKVLFGGGFNFGGVGSDSLKLARVLADGSVDPTFQPSIRKDHSNMVNPTANAIAVQPDDKIVVGGSNLFSGISPAFNRLLPDGQVDTEFQIGNGPSRSNGWSPHVALVRIMDSKIYVFGTFDRYNNEVCQSFVILDMQGKKIGPDVNALPSTSYFQDVEIQPDGKVVLMGAFPLSDADNRDFIRLNQDGSLDNTFLLKTVAGNRNDFEIDEDGNILIAGNSLGFVSNQILLRYKPDGALDNTLAQGTGFTRSAASDFITGYFVEVLKPDLIAVGGAFSGYNGNSSPALVFMDYQGSIVSFENNYDSTSTPVGAVVNNNILYLTGNLSKEKGRIVSSAAKVLFPLTGSIADQNVQAQSESSMLITWNGTFGGAEKITIEQSTPDAMNYELVASVRPHEQSYTVGQLSELTPYHFRIKASNEYYGADPFELKDTTLIAPQIALSPTEISSDSFVANWEYLPGTDSCLLQVSKDGFSTFLNGYENLILTTGSQLIEGLESGKMYEYRVKRFRHNKASAFSDAIAINIVSTIEEKGRGVRLYPNPVKDYLTVELPGPVASSIVTIQSLRGELLRSYTFDDSASLQMDMTHLPPGIFILTVSAGERRQRFKIVRSE
ncbi:MAG: T9SS type A sorting domain-containing protein [Chryseosolibacter sp.]